MKIDIPLQIMEKKIDEPKFKIEDVEKKESKDRTREEHLFMLKYKHNGDVRAYLLSMGAFKDVPLKEDKK